MSFCRLPTLQVNLARERHQGGRLDRLSSSLKTAFALHMSILLALLVGGTYAGTSGLFAAYIAGASISWWDLEVSTRLLAKHLVRLLSAKAGLLRVRTNYEAMQKVLLPMELKVRPRLQEWLFIRGSSRRLSIKS